MHRSCLDCLQGVHALSNLTLNSEKLCPQLERAQVNTTCAYLSMMCVYIKHIP